MHSKDVVKAAGVAIGLLVFNMLIVILAVVTYAQLIEPGQPQEFYDAAAMRIAPWCTRTIGSAAFFAVGYFLAKSRPDRNGLLFALLFSLFYALLDAATVGFAGALNIEFLLAMLANCIVALAGALFAARANSKASTESET